MNLANVLRMLLMKYRNKEFIRFLVVGCMNTLLTYLLYLILLLFFSYNVAYSCSYIGGIIFSYYLNVLFVFKKKVEWKSFLQFPLVYIFQYVISMSIINILVIYWGIMQTVAPIIAIIVTIPITFLLSKIVIGKSV